jgi:hypothetical protein
MSLSSENDHNIGRLTKYERIGSPHQGWGNRSEALEKGFIQIGWAVKMTPEQNAKEPI